VATEILPFAPLVGDLDGDGDRVERWPQTAPDKDLVVVDVDVAADINAAVGLDDREDAADGCESRH
jgi:hypothetical protein